MQKIQIRIGHSRMGRLTDQPRGCLLKSAATWRLSSARRRSAAATRETSAPSWTDLDLKPPGRRRRRRRTVGIGVGAARRLRFFLRFLFCVVDARLAIPGLVRATARRLPILALAVVAAELVLAASRLCALSILAAAIVTAELIGSAARGLPPPHLPAVRSSRVQQIPLTGTALNGHDVVVGVGQFPSLLRGLPSAQTVGRAISVPANRDAKTHWPLIALARRDRSTWANRRSAPAALVDWRKTGCAVRQIDPARSETTSRFQAVQSDSAPVPD